MALPAGVLRAGRRRGMHRERVAAAISHVTPDRCPLQVTFTPEFAERLRGDLHLGAAAGPHNPHGGGNPYDLEIALGQDLLITSVGWANSYYGRGRGYVDEWGVGWRSWPTRRPMAWAITPNRAAHPLADADAVTRYRPRIPAGRALHGSREGSSPSTGPSTGSSAPPSPRSWRRPGRCAGSSGC